MESWKGKRISAKAENGDNSVSIELLIRAMLAIGASPQDIGQVISQVK